MIRVLTKPPQLKGQPFENQPSESDSTSFCKIAFFDHRAKCIELFSDFCHNIILFQDGLIRLLSITARRGLFLRG
jgi:hypothetical protein